MRNNIIVTFDFDGTLSRKDVQEYAIELIKRGIDVWVLTTRYDELHKHRYEPNPTNDDLLEVIDNLNIPRFKVIFTNMEWKANYLLHTNVLLHLDDNYKEFINLRNMKCKTLGVQVNCGSFRNKCNRIIVKRLKLWENIESQ